MRFGARCYEIIPSPIRALIAIMTAGFVLGFGISSIETIPSYAPVYIDDNIHQYIALPCVEEWQRRSGSDAAIVRLSTAGEAHRLGYEVDADCRNLGGFSATGRSLSGMLLERAGLLSPLKQWWDMPYRTEAGEIVYPGQTK